MQEFRVRNPATLTPQRSKGKRNSRQTNCDPWIRKNHPRRHLWAANPSLSQYPTSRSQWSVKAPPPPKGAMWDGAGRSAEHPGWQKKSLFENQEGRPHWRPRLPRRSERSGKLFYDEGEKNICTFFCLRHTYIFINYFVWLRPSHLEENSSSLHAGGNLQFLLGAVHPLLAGQLHWQPHLVTLLFDVLRSLLMQRFKSNYFSM